MADEVSAHAQQEAILANASAFERVAFALVRFVGFFLGLKPWSNCSSSNS